MDHDTIANVTSGAVPTVTVRERDTCGQLRMPLVDVAPVLRELVAGSLTWGDLVATRGYTLVTTGTDKAAAAVTARL